MAKTDVRAMTGWVMMHLDMDAFFVSCELLSRPDLRGRKLIVARQSSRSVVLSASYEARACGVKSAMPLARAKELCPDALILEPQANYQHYSARVMDILRQVTDRVEQVSVDEAFVDLTPTLRRLGDPVETAQQVRQQIMQELSLPSSVGIAPSKFLAKMASSGSKPNGLWVIPPQKVQDFLDPLPVGKLWGVGPKTALAIEALGVRTVAQLRELNQNYLVSKFGQSAGRHLYQIARGIDPRQVVTERVEKSLGAEHTFGRDCTDSEELSRELYTLCLSVGRRLRASQKQTKSISLKIRFSNFQTLTRACTLPDVTDSGQQIYRGLLGRLKELEIIGPGSELPRSLRLIGVRAERLASRDQGLQESLFTQELEIAKENYLTNWHEAETTMDEIQKRFGAGGLLPANLLQRPTANLDS